MTAPSDPTLTPDELFRLAELQAERLIAYMRLGITTTLALAFVLVLQASDAPIADVMAGSDLRRWQVYYALATMGAYFLLGFLCIVLIRIGLFRSWMVWPSAAGDCFFILAGTYLGLENTELSADYTIVMPTLWLIPVVLASGVLRFNPKVQAFIIVLLVVGLLGVAWLAPVPAVAPTSEVLDVFFADPPNLMQLVMVSLAGIILVVATYRTRALFLRTLAETERRVNLTRYVPAEVAPQLAQSGLKALQSGARQDMAVVFVDMRGFTTRAETMAPEDLSGFMTEYRRRITQSARAHVGVIDKFIGDAVLVVFATSQGTQTPSARAIACAHDILEGIGQWSEDLPEPVHVGIGIHYGTLFAGVIGDEDRLEYSVFGDVVNIAARLEELTKTSGMSVVISEPALRNAGDAIEKWTALPATQIRGRKSAINIFGH